jgi:hypothetical protein
MLKQHFVEELRAPKPCFKLLFLNLKTKPAALALCNLKPFVFLKSLPRLAQSLVNFFVQNLFIKFNLGTFNYL